MMTLLERLQNNPTEEQIARVHADMARASVPFADYGDPRTWFDRTDDSTGKGPEEIRWGFMWPSQASRDEHAANYDDWVRGAWNDVPGVVKPSKTNNRFQYRLEGMHPDVVKQRYETMSDVELEIEPGYATMRQYNEILFTALFAKDGDPQTWPAFEDADDQQRADVIALFDDWKAGRLNRIRGVTPPPEPGLPGGPSVSG